MINRDHLHVTISNHNYPIPRDNLNQYHVKKLGSTGFMDHLKLLRSDYALTGADLIDPKHSEWSSGPWCPSLYKDGTIDGSLSGAVLADSRKNLAAGKKSPIGTNDILAWNQD